MTRYRALAIGLVLVLAAAILSAWTYPLLPDRVPSHWDLAGHVNGYSSRLFAAVFMPATAGFFWLLMLVLPMISPRGFRLGQSVGVFYTCLLAVLALLVLIHFITLRAALTNTAPSKIVLFAAIGVLFAIVGSLMGRLKKNFWIGVRTPWTLASDEVWLRTNRLAGRLFVAGGIVIVLASFFGGAVVPILLAVIGIVALFSVGYSYVIYRRIEGFDPES
jgi:uncharacterized membrane protein